ncbi:metallophosphoesterase family protein [Candidatus Woesearchaeota archaeon]|nr:metallophosphoesterase family protein [Candidatus Woesearchaeota archaeon]
MKILAFTDIHCSTKALKKIIQRGKKKDVDCLACAGDISIFEQHLEYMMRKLDTVGKCVFIVPGNHETPEVLKKLCSYTKNLVFLHKQLKKFKDVTFIGFEGDGFSFTDSAFRGWAKQIEKRIRKKGKIVLITHAPPHHTKVDLLIDEHCGNKDIRRFLERNTIALHICGHLHENAGVKDVVKGTKVVNPGPYGVVVEV